MALGEVLKTSSVAPFHKPQDFQSCHHPHDNREQHQEFQELEAFRQGLKGFQRSDRRQDTTATTSPSFSPPPPAKMRSALPSRPMATSKNDADGNSSRVRIRSPPPEESGGSNRSSVARSPKLSHDSNSRHRSSRSPSTLSQQPLSPASVVAESTSSNGAASGGFVSASAAQQDTDAQSDVASSVVQGLSGQVCR